MKTQQFRSFQKKVLATKFVAKNTAYFLSNSALSIPLFPYRQKNSERAESPWVANSAYFAISNFMKERGKSGKSGKSGFMKKEVL